MIYVVSIHDQESLKKYAAYEWVYIGQFSGLEQARLIFSPSKRRFIAQNIQRLAESLKRNFLDYIGQLSMMQPDLILWYSSCIASKSLSQAAIYKQYIYLKLIQEWSHSGDDCAVVTDDQELLSAIHHFTEDGIKPVSPIVIEKVSLKDNVNAFLKKMKYIASWLLVLPRKNKLLNTYEVIFHSWIDERTFSALPEFVNPYFNRLPHYFSGQGKKVGYLTYGDIGWKYVFKLSGNFENIIFPWSYIGVIEFFKGLVKRFKIEFDEKRFSGIGDLPWLIFLSKREEARENQTVNYLCHYLSYFAYRKLAKHLKKDVTLFYPFENQHWEKMLCAALNGVNLIGYQHASLPINELYYQTSRFETKQPLPKMILSSGKKWLEVLGEHYDKKMLQEGGALRYAYLFERDVAASGEKDSHAIVIALSINVSAAVSLQRNLLELLEKSLLTDKVIKIKPHPQLPADFTLTEEFSRFGNCRIVNDSIDSLLKDCAVFVGCDSTVLYEASFFNVRTATFIPEELIYGCEYLLWDKIDCLYEKDFKENFLKLLVKQDRVTINPQEFFSKPDFNVFEGCLKGKD